jgi:hypothetical protein
MLSKRQHNALQSTSVLHGADGFVSQRHLGWHRFIEARLTCAPAAWQVKAAALPPEPSPDEEATTSCLIRLPSGARCSRRFRVSDPVTMLFDFVDAQVRTPASTCRQLVEVLSRLNCFLAKLAQSKIC